MYIILATLLFLTATDSPEFEAELLFPPEPYHNHSSSIVETAQGDLLVCWFHGHGERKDDTLVISGSRKRKGASAWSAPFLMADNQDLPDQNPVLFIDPRGVLWLFWISSLDNEVRSHLLKYRTATYYDADGPPAWDWQDTIMCRPKDMETAFLEVGDSKMQAMASDKLFQRLGWMTRQPPIMLSDTRMMLGLYSDVYDCSLMAFTEDWGKTWQYSRPMVLKTLRSIQPALVKKQDGGIAAFMRAAIHIRRADSQDGGMTWTEVPMSIPNPGSSVACISLKNGNWILVCNDTLVKRNMLTVYLSEDEGNTWGWKRPLERLDLPGSASYPTVIQAADGTIHCTYSFKNPAVFEGSTIKHVQFNETWVCAGEKL